MIRTSIGNLQVGSPWLARQWINSVPGITVTPGITQNNLTIRAGNRRPSFTTAQGAEGSGSSAPGTVSIPIPGTDNVDFGFFIGDEFTYIKRRS